jgi:Undecaprenyl-phosphate glucose phosphotransferase
MKRYTHFAATLLAITDLVSVTAAWAAAFFLRFFVEIIPVTKTYPSFPSYLKFVPIVWAAWFFSARLVGLYRLEMGRPFGLWTKQHLQAATVAVILLTALTFFYREFAFARFSRVVMAYFWVLVIVLSGPARGVAQVILRRMRQRGYEVRRILIAGTGEVGRDLCRRMQDRGEFGLEVMGFLSDRREDVGMTLDGVPVVGQIEDVRKAIRKSLADQLFIALPLDASDRLKRVLEGLGEEAIDIKVVPDFLRYMKLNAGIEDFDGLPVIRLREGPLYGWNSLVKRAMDVVLSGLALIFLSPLMFLIFLVIKLTSKGPVFYRQERMGLDRVPFQMIKFRSMQDGAENETGAVWASADDPRRTRMGSLLRRMSLDELPQLFNVLKGEMSLVGPRPERPVFVEQFQRSVPGYVLRHKVKAGITGWAQVNGWRGQTSLEKRIECDLYYMEHWSLWFDFKIIWLTLFGGILDRHAY